MFLTAYGQTFYIKSENDIVTFEFLLRQGYNILAALHNAFTPVPLAA